MCYTGNGDFKNGCIDWNQIPDEYLIKVKVLNPDCTLYSPTQEEINEAINFHDVKVVNMTKLGIENFTEKEMIKLVNRNGKLTLIQRLKRAIFNRSFKEFMVKKVDTDNEIKS